MILVILVTTGRHHHITSHGENGSRPQRPLYPRNNDRVHFIIHKILYYNTTVSDAMEICFVIILNLLEFAEDSIRTRGNKYKLTQHHCHYDLRKYNFTNRVIPI